MFLYSGKSVCNRANVVVLGQSGCVQVNLLYLGKSGCILSKVHVFGKVVLLGQKLLSSGKRFAVAVGPQPRGEKYLEVSFLEYILEGNFWTKKCL